MNRIITNFDQLAATSARKDALMIAEKGYQAIAIGPAYRHALQLDGSTLTIHEHAYDLNQYKSIYVIGAGKGASQAAQAVEERLGDRITAGAVNDVVITSGLKRITGFQGTHPLPSRQNLAATDRMLELAEQATADDLVITIICGGGSALFTRPAEGVSVEKLAEVRLHMLRSGASIEEINTVYKHISRVHGGYLSLKAFPATVLTLAVSDVPHDDPFVIASGPTIPDKTTIHDAETVAAKYGLHDLPLIETPGEDEFSGRHAYVILASADLAVAAMMKEAEQLGYTTAVAGYNLVDQAETVGAALAAKVQAGQAIIFAGELPVMVKNPDGLGGRMQHMAVSALPHLSPSSVAIGCASDGSDYMDGVAGAIVDGTQTHERCRRLGLNAEAARQGYNSYPLLRQTGDLLSITPGITANVSDFGIFLKKV